jgi:hypothetical protein
MPTDVHENVAQYYDLSPDNPDDAYGLLWMRTE